MQCDFQGQSKNLLNAFSHSYTLSDQPLGLWSKVKVFGKNTIRRLEIFFKTGWQTEAKRKCRPLPNGTGQYLCGGKVE